MAKDADLLKDFEAAYSEAVDKWAPWWLQAKLDLEFKMGKQWSNDDLAKMKAQERDPLVFNRVRRAINVVSGYERKNRLTLRVSAIAGDPQTASLLSGCVQWQMSYESCYMTMSKAFENGALTTGINLVELWMDYSEDPVDGDIQFSRVPYNQMLLDPNFTEISLSDCQYMMRRKWLTKPQAKMLLPFRARAIDQLRPKGRDSKFPESDVPNDYRGASMLRLDQFYRRETQKAKSVLNMVTGDLQTWEGTSRELDDILTSTSPMGVPWGQIVNVIDRWMSVIKVAYILDDNVYWDGTDPTGLNDYPFVASIGYWEPEYDQMSDKLQGIVRAIRDPQTESNRRRVKILDILDQTLLGLKVKEDSVVDPNSPYQTGQGNVVWMKKTADVSSDIQPMVGPGLPPGLLESSQVMDNDMNDVLGLSGEVTGMPDEGEAAQAFILAKLRQAAGLTTLQSIMDNKRFADKLLGQKLVGLIQKNFSPKKVQRITDQQPTKEFYDKNFGKYDCIPTEGALTDSQRQMRYGEATALKLAGAPIPWSTIFQYSALELAPELIKMMQDQEQQQAAGLQAQQAAQTEQQKAEVALLAATALRNKTQMMLDQAKANQLEAQAGSDRMKAMEQIAGMRSDQLLKLVQLVLQVEKEGGFGVEPASMSLPLPGASKPIQTPAAAPAVGGVQ
jgi:hypothetical protein